MRNPKKMLSGVLLASVLAGITPLAGAVDSAPSGDAIPASSETSILQKPDQGLLPGEKTAALEIAKKTEVVLKDGTITTADKVTVDDKVASVKKIAPVGNLKDQIGKGGARMGQLKEVDPTAPASTPYSALRTSGAAAAVSAYSYTDPGAILGQDVSSFQTGVNFYNEKAKGSKFTYIKTTEGYYDYENPAFSDQWASATNAGIYRGAYHFALPTQSDGASQARYMVSKGGGWSADGRTLPGVLDMEWNPYSSLGNMCFNMTQVELIRWISDYQITYKQLTGRYPMIYTAPGWWNTCVGSMPSAGVSPLWNAWYNTTPGPVPANSGWYNYDMWQFSDSGIFAGDQNVFAGDAVKLADLVNNANYKPFGISPTVTTSTSPVGINDVVVIDRTTGGLYKYINGVISLNNRQEIYPTGFQNAISVHVADWNGNGINDLIIQTADGRLEVRYGYADGTFTAPTTRGWGWTNNLEITVGKYLPTDKFPSIYAQVKSNGGLRLYRGDGKNVNYEGYKGWGWNNYHPRFVQADSTAMLEIVGRRPSDNAMMVYSRNADGTFASTPPTVGGTGFGAMTQLAGTPNYKALMGRVSTGKVYKWELVNKKLQPGILIGDGGWNTHAFAGSSEFTK